MYKDNPMLYLGELSKEVLYPDQPLGWPVSGKKEAVANLNQQKLIEFRTKHYTPGNMIISIAGAKNLDWETEVKKHMHQKAGKLSKGFERAEVFQQKPRMLLHSRKTDQAHLFIGVKTFPRIDKRRPILKMINGILGGMMSSRIFYQIREKRGLAYYVSSEIDEYIDAGNFGVSTGIKVGKIQEVIEIILNEFDKIRKKKVPKGELDKAKENYKGKMYLGLEDSLSVASFATEQEIFWGEIKKPEQIVEEIEKVTPDDIIKLAGEIFISERLNLALIGPYKDENKFQKLLEI
jgi:predicted Zn-dependent peptidase